MSNLNEKCSLLWKIFLLSVKKKVSSEDSEILRDIRKELVDCDDLFSVEENDNVIVLRSEEKNNNGKESILVKMPSDRYLDTSSSLAR